MSRRYIGISLVPFTLLCYAYDVFIGTVVSLILVVTLLTVMYCLLRRRLNVATRQHMQHVADGTVVIVERLIELPLSYSEGSKRLQHNNCT